MKLIFVFFVFINIFSAKNSNAYNNANVKNTAKGFNKVSKNINIFLVGDSTVSNKSGWGDSLKLYLNSKVTVKNLAKDGRSSKSFYEEKNNNWNENKSSVMKNIRKATMF